MYVFKYSITETVPCRRRSPDDVGSYGSSNDVSGNTMCIRTEQEAGLSGSYSSRTTLGQRRCTRLPTVSHHDTSNRPTYDPWVLPEAERVSFQ